MLDRRSILRAALLGLGLGLSRHLPLAGAPPAPVEEPRRVRVWLDDEECSPDSYRFDAETGVVHLRAAPLKVNGGRWLRVELLPGQSEVGLLLEIDEA